VVIRTDRTVKARLDCRVADFVMLSSPARGDVGILGRRSTIKTLAFSSAATVRTAR